MKQYKITSEDINQNSPDDCYLDPTDPIQELKIVQYLAGLGGQARLEEYKSHQKSINKGSNISLTGSKKAALMKKHDIKPGTAEWFQLWFSRPFMTGEKPIGK